MAFIVSGTGERTAESHNGSSAQAPTLHISYTPNPPTVYWTNPSDGQLFTDLDTITFMVNASDHDDNVSKVEFFVGTTLIETDTTAPYSIDWSTTTLGNYTLKAVATDTNGNESEQEIIIGIQDGTSLSVQVNNGNDDAEEVHRYNGYIRLTSSDLELINDGDGDQTIGIRFDNINIPPDGIVTNAYIQFTVDNYETDTISTNLTIHGEAHDDPPSFEDETNNITDRSTTTDSVNWNSIPSWTNEGDAGVDQRSPNLSAIAQEIINRPGWSANNAMAFIITGSGERTAESYNDIPSKAPTLHLTYYTLANSCDPYADADNDNVCSDVDCDDNDATIYIGATCNDGAPNTGSDVYNSNCTCAGTPATNLVIRVNKSIDDAEEESDGEMKLISSDLDINDGNKTTGMRFENIDVPSYATITNAYIQFTVKDTSHVNAVVTIKGEDHANPPSFESSDDNITNRAVTTNSVNWTVGPWEDYWVAGTDQQTPDLSDIVQELVGLSGWAANNSMVFFVETGSGIGSPAGHSYEADDSCRYYAPTFHVSYIIDTTASSVTISSQINTASDDAEENNDNNGEMDLWSTDLELISENGNTDQTVGLRFNNINVPSTANITNAYIQFTVDDTNSGLTNLDIYGHDDDNPSTFSSSNQDISSRTKTSTSVSWNSIPAWTTIGQAGPDQQTPDLSGIVQEIIDRSGWSANNSMAFIITGSGEREAESYDGQGGNSPDAPVLYITYTDNGSSPLIIDPNNQPADAQPASLDNLEKTDAAVPKEKSLLLFPNPTSALLNVHYQSTDGQIAFMELFDPTGRRIHFSTLQTKKGLNEVQMDLIDLPEGLYFFRVMEAGEYLTEKVLISN